MTERTWGMRPDAYPHHQPVRKLCYPFKPFHATLEIPYSGPIMVNLAIRQRLCNIAGGFLNWWEKSIVAEPI